MELKFFLPIIIRLILNFVRGDESKGGIILVLPKGGKCLNSDRVRRLRASVLPFFSAGCLSTLRQTSSTTRVCAVMRRFTVHTRATSSDLLVVECRQMFWFTLEKNMTLISLLSALYINKFTANCLYLQFGTRCTVFTGSNLHWKRTVHTE